MIPVPVSVPGPEGVRQPAESGKETETGRP
jgi:hypothetical protein